MEKLTVGDESVRDVLICEGEYRSGDSIVCGGVFFFGLGAVWHVLQN